MEFDSNQASPIIPIQKNKRLLEQKFLSKSFKSTPKEEEELNSYQGARRVLAYLPTTARKPGTMRNSQIEV